MKRFSLFIFAFIMTISFLFVTVNADTKKYTTESVDFDVLLTEDGDAEITETWVVNYEVGEFTRFRKNIYMNLPEEEYFSNIADLEVEVDGEEYDLTFDGSNRPEGCYSSSYSDSIYTYEIYFRKSEERTKIEVSYVLKDVVKCVDDEYYLFVYRFLPKGYKDNIKNFSIDIRTENDNDGMKVLYKTKGKTEVDDNAIIEASNVSDLFKVKVRINGEAFDYISSISTIDSSDVSNDRPNKKSDSYNDFVEIICTFLTIGLFIGCAVVPSLIIMGQKKKKEKQWKLEYEENPYMFERKVYDTVESWIGKYFSPAMFVTQITKNYYFSFFAFLADLHSRQLINFSEDSLYLYYFINSKYYENGYDKEIYDLLQDIKTYGMNKGTYTEMSGNCYILPISVIREYFSEFDNYSNLREVLFKTVSSVILEGEEKKRFKRDREFIGYALGLLPKKKIKYEDILKNYGRIGSAMDLLYFTIQDNTVLQNDFDTTNVRSQNDLDRVNGLDFVVASMAILSYDYYVEECAKRHINVNTGYSCSSCGGSSCSSCGSSCSSCSSCSGCGGCGGSD